VLLSQRVPAPVAQQRRDLAGAEGVLDAEHDRDREPSERVRGEDADRVRAAGDQAASQRVGLEAELLGRGEHALAGRGAELATSVDGLGRGAHRHACARGNVGHRGDRAALGGHLRASFHHAAVWTVSRSTNVLDDHGKPRYVPEKLFRD
jgi:hypothetical protein